MSKRQLPLLCVLLAIGLVVVATRLYPGGTLEEPQAVGFDFRRNYLTQLFRPVAVNGQMNGGRLYAAAGMWLFCLGMAELFRQLANDMASTTHRKWVRIFGIATMVYAALTVTRMHDLMETISLLFFVAAKAVLLDWLWRRRQLPQWTGGIANLVLVLTAAVVYYGQVATVVLPTLQKLVFVSSVSWLFWLHKRSDTELVRAVSASSVQ